MGRTGWAIALSVLGLVAAGEPARAWDGDGPFSFLFHRYGDDMYQPPITPARPYWHGDDAVPPSLRWHDREVEIVDDYGFTVATRLPPPDPLIAEQVAPPRADLRPRRHHVRRAHPHPARLACPPGPVPVAAAAVSPVVLPPPVPAPTEH